MIEFQIPIKTVNPVNGSHGHWRTTAAIRKRQRQTTFLLAPKFDIPAVITLTRVSAGVLDDDNLRPALKSVRDGIADKLGIADNDPRVTWRYAQQKCKRGTWAVRVTVEAPESRCATC